MQKNKQEKTVQIFGDVRVTHYPVEQTHIHIVFEFGYGMVFKYKFKDPRDALKYIITRVEDYHPIIGEMLYDYIESNISVIQYTPLELYYIEILKFKIPFITSFFMSNPMIKNIISFDNGYKNELNQEEFLESNKEFEEVYFKYKKELNAVTRMAHKWAVANTWWYYNYYKKTLNSRKEGIPNNLSLFDENFCSEYKSKKVVEATEFSLRERLWKVEFEDGSWIICYDTGNGWYKPITDFNSYKLII